MLFHVATCRSGLLPIPTLLRPHAANHLRRPITPRSCPIRKLCRPVSATPVAPAPLLTVLKQSIVANPAHFLLSLAALIAGVSLAAFLVAAIPSVLAFRRTAIALESLAAAVEAEVPDTAAAVRLSGFELSDCIEEVALLRYGQCHYVPLHVSCISHAATTLPKACVRLCEPCRRLSRAYGRVLRWRRALCRSRSFQLSKSRCPRLLVCGQRVFNLLQHQSFRRGTGRGVAAQRRAAYRDGGAAGWCNQGGCAAPAWLACSGEGGQGAQTRQAVSGTSLMLYSGRHN